MKGRRDWTSGIAVSLALAALLAFASPVAADDDRISPRIVGGEPTTTGTYPWQAALVFDARFPGSDFERQFCAGALITPRIVQTAAHCVFDGDPDDPSPPAPSTELDHDDLDVILGRTTLTDTAGEELDVKADVDGIYVDPAFDPDTFDRDFAWIVLAADSAQQPIKIAGPGENALWDPGSPTEATGWGIDDSGDPSDTLRFATLPIASDAVCADAYGTAFRASSMICAGYTTGAADACFGDSGGALQAPTSQAGTYRLVGNVSWGEQFCSHLGVYSRAVAFDHQSVVDFLEAIEALPDGGPIVGTGATPPPPPPNDDFAAAQSLGSSLAGGAAGETYDAGLELGEPNHGGGGASVWYRWTAPTTGSTTVSLCGSNFDTLLAVYGGSAVDVLGPPLAANDDDPDCGLSSTVTFASTAGSAYRIAVDGFGGAVGEAELSLAHATTPPTPPGTTPPEDSAPPTPVTPAKKCPKGKKLKKGRCVKKKKGSKRD